MEEWDISWRLLRLPDKANLVTFPETTKHFFHSFLCQVLERFQGGGKPTKPRHSAMFWCANFTTIMQVLAFLLFIILFFIPFLYILTDAKKKGYKFSHWGILAGVALVLFFAPLFSITALIIYLVRRKKFEIDELSAKIGYNSLLSGVLGLFAGIPLSYFFQSSRLKRIIDFGDYFRYLGERAHEEDIKIIVFSCLLFSIVFFISTFYYQKPKTP